MSFIPLYFIFSIADFVVVRFHLVCMRKLSRTSMNCIRHPANVWAICGYCSRFSQYTSYVCSWTFYSGVSMRMCLSIELWANWEERKKPYTRDCRLTQFMVYDSFAICVFLFLLFSSCCFGIVGRVNETKVRTHTLWQQTETTAAVATHDHIWWMALVEYVHCGGSPAQRISVHRLNRYHASCRSFQLALQSNRTRGSMIECVRKCHKFED